MNAGGLNIVAIINSQAYYFDNMKITVSNRTEDTVLADGELYRVRTGIYSGLITLKKRLKYTEISEYKELMESLAQKSGLTIVLNGMSFRNYALLKSQLTSEEGEPFADFEVIFTGSET